MSTLDTPVMNTPIANQSASVEGKICIDIFRQQQNTGTVTVRSSRPLQASQLLIGKTPQQALSIIPLVFSICGVAQSRAAIACFEQMLHISTEPEIETARDMLVLVENTKEHLLRLFIDWPRLFQLTPDNTSLLYPAQILAGFKNALFHQGEAFRFDSLLNDHISDTDYLIDKLEQYLQENVFDCQPADWLKIRNTDELHQWALQTETIAAKSIAVICEQGLASQGLTDYHQLPAIDDKALLKKFDAPNAQQFIEQPEWNGTCYETTVLSRQFKQALVQSLHDEFQTSLITRWVARLVELAGMPKQLRDSLEQITHKTQQARALQNKTGMGIKQVEAARGRLVHRVKISDGIIHNYQILAPTEWNFHPRGLAAKSLATLAASRQNSIDQAAHLLINAIDPCVGYDLRIH